VGIESTKSCCCNHDGSSKTRDDGHDEQAGDPENCLIIC
jgi:hypothetical protein